MKASLDGDHQAYIEKFSNFAQSYGLPKSAAKVLGFLLICEPSRQTAQSIKENLHLSAGSVSSAVALLVGVGMIERIKLAGDKRHYYEIQPGNFQQAILGRLQSARESKRLAEEGLKINASNVRFVAMHDVFSLIETELIHVVKKFDELKKH